MRSKLKKDDKGPIADEDIKLDNLEESIKKLIEKSIKEKIDTITDEKLQKLLLPLVQIEFTEKIAPAIETNINDRIDRYMLRVKDVVRVTLKEIFDTNVKLDEIIDEQSEFDTDSNN